MTPLEPVEERALQLIGLGLAPEAATAARIGVALDLSEDAARQVTRLLKRTGLITPYGAGWKVTSCGHQYLRRAAPARPARVAA